MNDERVMPVDRAEPAPDPARMAAVRTDLSGGAESAELMIAVAKPRPVRRYNDSSDTRIRRIMPLVVVAGHPVELGEGRAIVTVPVGKVLVEVMDDHQYDSRTVDVPSGEQASLWIGVGQLRRENRIRLGTRPYAGNDAMAKRMPQMRAGLICFAIAGIGIVATGQTITPLLPAMSLNALLYAMWIGLAVTFYRPLRRGLALRQARRTGEIVIPSPEPVADGIEPGRPVCLLPAEVSPPATGPAICLRVIPEPESLDYIAIRARVGQTSGKFPYFSNDFDDWLAAPEVTVNGWRMPSRWGVLWIPLRPGPVRLQVRLPGFADPRRPDRPPLTRADASLDFELGDTVRHVDCHFNIIGLAAERVRIDPSTESEWQRALNEQGLLDKPRRLPPAPPLRLSLV